MTLESLTDHLLFAWLVITVIVFVVCAFAAGFDGDDAFGRSVVLTVLWPIIFPWLAIGFVGDLVRKALGRGR